MALFGPAVDGDGLPSNKNGAWGGWRDIECTSGADNRLYLERHTRNSTNGIQMCCFIFLFLFVDDFDIGIEFVERRDEVDFAILTTLGGATASLEER